MSMPLPFIPAAIFTIGTGLSGVKKGLTAKKDIKKAKSVNLSANKIARESEEYIVKAKDKTREAIEELGREKINVLTTSITDFIFNFEKIKNMKLNNSDGIDELRNFDVDEEKFADLKEASFEAKKIAVNGLAAIGSGALVSYGTYSVVMSGLGGMILSSTGTAIGTLSGVTATNATLAWLGGGSLAAGGLGKAGCMLVLGGLATGPALAVGGTLIAGQARKALNDSYSNYNKAILFKSQARSIGLALKSMYIRANQLRCLLTALDSIFNRYVEKLKDIIRVNGTDWDTYSLQDKKDIYICVQLAQTIKAILDSTLINKDGKLEERTQKVLMMGNEYLNKVNKL